MRCININQDQLNVLMSPEAYIPTQEELFDHQIGTLLHKGIVKNPGQFKDLRRSILSERLFLLVPQTNFSISKLMSFIELDGKKGFSGLNESHLKDVIKTPKRHYIATNIKDGREMPNISPQKALKELSQKKRSGWTVREGIFYVIYFPFVLKNHSIDLVGSRYESGGVPSLYLVGDGPKLHWHCPGLASSSWSVASCGSRVWRGYHKRPRQTRR